MTDTQPVLRVRHVRHRRRPRGPSPRLRRHADHRRRASGASPHDRDGAIAVLRRAVELGVDFIDTADSYGPFVSEDLIREALHPYGHVRIATKAGLTRQGPGVWTTSSASRPTCASAPRCRCAASASRPSTSTSCTASTRTCRSRTSSASSPTCVAEGKVRHVGLSEVSVDELRRRAGDRADRHRPEPLQRRRTGRARRCSTTAPSTASASSRGSPSPRASSPRPTARSRAIAARTGHTPAQLALAWLLRRSPVMLPDPGHQERRARRGELRGRARRARRRDLRRARTRSRPRDARRRGPPREVAAGCGTLSA